MICHYNEGRRRSEYWKKVILNSIQFKIKCEGEDSLIYLSSREETFNEYLSPLGKIDKLRHLQFNFHFGGGNRSG